MNCYYCGAPSEEDDHRCRRCGRRLDGRVAPQAPPRQQQAVIQSSPIRQPAPQRPVNAPIPDPRPAPRQSPPVSRNGVKRPVVAPGRCAPRQAQLFPTPVVRFDEFSPSENVKRSERKARPPSVPGMEKKASPRKRVIPGQQALFPPPAPTEQPMGRSRPEPTARYSQYHVAQPAHRMMAAFMDLGLITAGLIPVFLFFRAAGGDLIPDKSGMSVHVVVTCLVAFFYKALWLLAERDSPGMIWTNLRLVNFDNQPPTRRQRACRLAAGCLSVASAGLGLIWALADQEKLTWHDHISKTFPTPQEPRS